MKPIHRLIVALTLIAALPSLGCFTYYTSDAVSESGRDANWLELLAYPGALLSGAGLVFGLTSAANRRGLVKICIAGLLTFSVLLILPRLSG